MDGANAGEFRVTHFIERYGAIMGSVIKPVERVATRIGPEPRYWSVSVSEQ